MLAPQFKKGAAIGWCSPSSLPSRESAQKYIRNIERMGLKVIVADNIFNETDGYLPSIEERAADFNQMIHDDRVELILFSGGEGGPEILPYIDYEYLKAHPKPLLSYSDGTSESIGTDNSWLVAKSNLRMCHLYHGIRYNATLTPSFNKKAIIAKDNSQALLIPQEGEFVKEQERLSVKNIIITGNTNCSFLEPHLSI